MPHTKLATALKSIDWNKNVSEFLADSSEMQKIAKCNLRLAIWAKQLEECDKGNPALTFLREAQRSGHFAPILLSLALYKPAASSMRSMLESILYYTFFRTHHEEMATLVRNKEYFVDKKHILTYHKLHTVDFAKNQEKLALISKLEEWYSEISAVIHGQLPGVWGAVSKVTLISYEKKSLAVAADSFAAAEEVVHKLLLCTAGQTFWHVFAPASKRELLKGIPTADRKVLGLDSA